MALTTLPTTGPADDGLPPYLSAVMWTCVISLAVGGLANLWAAYESYFDWKWVKLNSRDAAKRRLAFQFFRTDAALTAFQAVVCSIRYWATDWPRPGNPAFASRWAADIVIFTLAQLCFLTVPAVLNFVDRRAIADMVRPRKGEPA